MHLNLTRICLFAFLLCIDLNPVFAQTTAPDQDWSVVEVSGSVTLQDASGRDLMPLRSGQRLSVPLTVETGSDGRLVLAHGQDHLTVSPGTRFAIPAARRTDKGLVTWVKQTLGSLLYQVEHRTSGGFEVETPYLVSVVKGTTFNILVTSEASTVALIEGRLWVHTPDGKSELTLEPGQAAIKSAHGDKILLKDQQSMSAPMTGPIRVVHDKDSGDEARTPGSGPIVSLNGNTAAIDASVDTPAGGALSVGLGTDDAVARLDGGVNVTPNIDVGDGTVSVSEAALSVEASAAGVDLGTTSVSVDGASISLEGTPAIAVDAVAVDVGATSVDVGAVPVVDVGASSIELGDISISGSATPMIDVSEASVDVGAVSVGDVAVTPSVDVDTSLSLDASTATVAASVDVGVADTSVASVDVTNTGVAVTIAPEEVVTTVTNTVSNTTNAAVHLLNSLPGL
jgi:hypothetical protein